MNGEHIRSLVVVLSVIVLISNCFLIPTVGATPEEPHEETIEVTLESDGSATMSINFVYDLTDDAEYDAFDAFAADEGATDDLIENVRTNMEQVASTTSDETDREMSVSNATVDFETPDDEHGIITIQFEWSNLAAENDTDRTLAEPFASNFTLDRSLVVHVQQEYTVSTVTPEPTAIAGDQNDEADQTTLYWDGTESLDGFTLVVTQPDDAETETNDTADTDDEPMPGFTILGSLIVLGSLIIAMRADKMKRT